MQHLSHLSKSQQESVLALIKAAHDFDGTPPIAEHVLLHLRHGGDKSDSHIVFESDNQVIAYATLIQLIWLQAQVLKQLFTQTIEAKVWEL